MGDPITWAAVGMAAVSNMGTWLMIWKGGKRNKKNNNPGPGQAKVCIERGEKIAKMETEQANIKDDIHEIKTAIEIIRAAVVK
jgi:hypothetical protein